MPNTLIESISLDIKSKNYELALKKIHSFPEKKLYTFQHIKLLFQTLMGLQRYDEAGTLIKNNYFKKPQYFRLLSDYYYQVNDSVKFQEAFESLKKFDVPKCVLYEQSEKLSILNNNYKDAARSLEKIIDLNDNFQPYLYKRLLSHYYSAKQYQKYLSTLENVLTLKPKFTRFNSSELFDSLLETRSSEEALTYLIKLLNNYQDNKSIFKLLDDFLTDSGLSKSRIDEILNVESLVYKSSNLNVNKKKFIKHNQANIDKINLDKTLTKYELYELLFRCICDEDYDMACNIAKKSDNMVKFQNIMDQVPKKEVFKRRTLSTNDLDNSHSIICSEFSDDANGIVIVFSGLAMKTMIPIEIMDRFFATLNINAIYLFDYKRTLYLNGIEGFDSIENTIHEIKKLIKAQTAQNVFTFGSSAGGMAAIIYGHILKATKSLVFSPPSNLAHPMETRGKLLIKRMMRNYSNDQLHINFYLKNVMQKIPVEVYCGEDMILDKAQVEPYLDMENMKVNMIKHCNRHDVITVLLEEKKFFEILNNSFIDSPKGIS